MTFQEKIIALLDIKNKQAEKDAFRKSIRLGSLYKESLKNIQNKLADLYAAYGDKIESGEFHQYNRLKNLERQIVLEIKRLNLVVEATINKTLINSYETAYYRTGFAYESTVATSMGFGLLNTKQVEAAIANAPYDIKWPNRLKKNNQVYAKQITEAIAKGITEGKGYSEIAQDVKARAEVGKNKTIRIIQTETHRAVEQGTNEAYKKVNNAAQELGIATRKRWISTLDSRTRDTHKNLDGAYADATGKFYSNGYSAKHPGNFGQAEEDINCRCSTVLELVGFEPTERRDNTTKKIIPYKNYNEWAQNLNN